MAESIRTISFSDRSNTASNATLGTDDLHLQRVRNAH